MNAINKTKDDLINELEILQKRVFELETIEKAYKLMKCNFVAKTGRFPHLSEQTDKAVYVIFDRKYEFINETFAEIFDVTYEEACSPGFDPMTLVAPESRHLVREKYREAIRGECKTQQYEFIGQTRNGLKLECEMLTLLIHYKWGVAIHGILRDITIRDPFADKEMTYTQQIRNPFADKEMTYANQTHHPLR